MESLPAGLPRHNNLYLMFSQWANHSPTEAAAAALQLSGSDRNRVISVIAEAWANQDPEAAYAWVNNLPAGTARNEAIGNVLGGYAAKDPKAAASIATQLPPVPLRTRRLPMSPTLGCSRTPPRQLLGFSHLPDGAARRYAIDNVVRYDLVYNDPQRATDLLALLPTNNESAGKYEQVANAWAGSDLPAALNWAKQLPEGTAKQKALQGVGSAWAKTDPAGAITFVLGLPAGNQQSELLSQHRFHLGRQ